MRTQPYPDDLFSAAVARLYEAAGTPEAWPATLDALEPLFGAMTAHLFSWDSVAQRRESSYGAHSFARTDQDWDYYHRINPRRKILASQPLGYILACNEHLNGDFVTRDEYFNDYCLPLERRYLLGTNFSSSGRILTSVAVMRTADQGPFGTREKGLLGRLLPHLRGALSLDQKLCAARAQATLSQSLLDALPQAVIAADAQGRVRYANRTAEALLASSTSLRQRQQRLAAATPGETAALLAALRRAIEAAPGANPGPASSLILHDETGAGLGATVTPLDRHAGLPEVPAQRLALLTLAPLAARRLDPAPLRAAFGFTGAEAELASALAGGARLDAIAAARGVRMPTVRSQLRALFDKTGTSRQAELVRLLATLPAAADQSARVSTNVTSLLP